MQGRYTSYTRPDRVQGDSRFGRVDPRHAWMESLSRARREARHQVPGIPQEHLANAGDRLFATPGQAFDHQAGGTGLHIQQPGGGSIRAPGTDAMLGTGPGHVLQQPAARGGGAEVDLQHLGHAHRADQAVLQCQRAAIGRAIVRDPAVFLMDEPLSNLDAKLRNQMRAEIIKLRQRINTTFIYVTHDQTEAMTLGDRIVIMKDGFIQQIGTPQEVFDHPANLFVAGFIGTPQMNFFDAKLVKNSDGKYAVAIDGINVELAEDKQARLSAKNVPEQDVTLGVRPDHIMLCADGVKGTVDVSELMGSSVHLHISTHDHDVVVIVPTNGNAAHFPMGSEVNMIFGGNVAHVFSKETEKNLEW